MRRTCFVLAVAALLAIGSLAIGQSSGLPNLKEAVEFVKYAVIAEVVEVKEFDDKVPWQIVNYRIVESLKGGFREQEIKKAKKKEDKEKAREFELVYIQSVNGSDGYGLPLPDKFVKKDEKYVLFFDTFKDKDGTEKLRAVTPDPASVDLAATDEFLKEVRELLKEWEKGEKEREKARNVKSQVNKEPFFKITKASDDWLIIDLEKVKKDEMAVQPTPQAKASVEKYYEGMHSKMFNQKAKAFLIMYSKKHETKATIDDMKKFAEEDIKKRYGDSVTITSCKKVACCREPGWAFKYETTSPDGKLKMYRERYVFIRKGQIFDIWMWCPDEFSKEMKKDFKKIMEKFRF